MGFDGSTGLLSGYAARRAMVARLPDLSPHAGYR